MIAGIVLLIIIAISALCIAIIEHRRRVAMRSRRLDEALFRRAGKDET
jgi:cell division protein FtsL